MAYTRINWQDGPSGGTPLSAANLNHMDQGIADAHADLDAATASPTANGLIRRDASGRASVADPTSASHIATKGYVDNNFAPIYPTIYAVDFDGTIEIEAGGFIEREVVIPSSLGNVRFGVIHTLPPVGLGFTVFNNVDITVGRRQTGSVGITQLALVVRLWNRGSSSLSFTGSFKIYLMIIPFP